MAGRRVVITGVASHWGARAGAPARARPGDRVPRRHRHRAAAGRPRRAPSSSRPTSAAPSSSRLLPGTGADTVVHCGILWYPEPGKPARVLHDINVIGTLQLLAACERTETLRALVVRGSAAIYGCEGAAPAFFTEEMAAHAPRCAPGSSATSPSSRPTSTTSPAGTPR